MQSKDQGIEESWGLINVFVQGGYGPLLHSAISTHRAGQTIRPASDLLQLALIINKEIGWWWPVPKMMLQEHGGQHSLIQHHSPGILIFYKNFTTLFSPFFWWFMASPAASSSSLSCSSTSWDSHPSGHVLGNVNIRLIGLANKNNKWQIFNPFSTNIHYHWLCCCDCKKCCQVAQILFFLTPIHSNIVIIQQIQ